jgi:transcriptional regulator with XRE-family HTH domain
MLYDTDRIRQALEDRNLSKVSRQTGVSLQTLYNIMRGHDNLSRDTLKALTDYIRSREDG